MINAVIFDLDGVLIDSEPLHCRADNQLLTELGIDPPGNYFDRFAGWTDEVMWNAVKKDFHISKSTDQIKEFQLSVKLKLLQEGDLKAISGVVELLKELNKGRIPTAIASSSQKVFIGAVIKKIEIAQYFELILSGEEVVNSKPEPDIFIKAAGLLNVDPSRCLVVEDSTSGTIAAKKAGMKCIGFKNVNSGNQDLSKADIIITDIKEILSQGLLNKLF
jgi:HAD superfamily hydrolase (TIGR01509 family)